MLTCKNILTFAPCIYFFQRQRYARSATGQERGTPTATNASRVTPVMRDPPVVPLSQKLVYRAVTATARTDTNVQRGRTTPEIPRHRYPTVFLVHLVSCCVFGREEGGVRAKDHSFVGQECQFVSRLLLCWKSGHLKLIL